MSDKYFIYYSTHSGTSEKFASMISQELQELKVNHSCENISVLTPQIFLQQNYFILLVSTHFDGESCKDGEKFYEWIQQDKNKLGLKNKKFTLFGLGDNTFPQFNRCSKNYYKKFREYEMEEFFPYEIGSDHDSNIEMDFLPWKTELINFIKNNHSINYQQNDQEKKIYIKGLNVKLQKLNTEEKEVLLKQKVKTSFFFTKYNKSKIGFIQNVKNCFKQEFEKNQTFQIEIELSKPNEYQSAQNIQIFPQNTPQIIDKIIQYFNLKDLNQQIVFEIENEKIKIPYSSGTDLKHALKHYIDVQEFPKHSFFKDLTNIVSNDKKQEILKTIQNQEEMQILKNKRYGVIEILKYLNIQLTLEQFLCISNPIKARYFTIASFSQDNKMNILLKKEFHINGNIEWRGLFTNQIMNFKSNQEQKIYYQIQQSTFIIPQKQSNGLLIGSGTGIAPMISIIEEKINNKDTNWRKLKVVYGLRNKDYDLIKENFFKKCLDEKIIDDLFLVESRKTNIKFYIQNFLQQRQDLIEEQLKNDDGKIFICGNLNMCNAVIVIIKQCMSKILNMNSKEIGDEFKNYQKQGKICFEAWG